MENILLWLYRFIVLLAMIYVILLTSKGWVPVSSNNTQLLEDIHATLENIDITITKLDDNFNFKTN